MKRILTLAFLTLITFSSCHRYYTSNTFDAKTSQHKNIAVMPPKMLLTGNQPKNYSAYDIELMEEKESKLFQEALFNNLLSKGNTGKYLLDVNIQPCANTLALLEKNNISLRQSWEKDDEELAKILGVDAIVRMSVQKQRYMSDLASAGIYAGRKIADAILNRGPSVTGNLNKTADIIATCTLVSNGQTLWNDSYRRDSDFNSPANEVIERITGNFAKHFPYRRKA